MNPHYYQYHIHTGFQHAPLAYAAPQCITSPVAGQVKLSVQQPPPLLAFSQMSTPDPATSQVSTDNSNGKTTTVTSTQNSTSGANYSSSGNSASEEPASKTTTTSQPSPDLTTTSGNSDLMVGQMMVSPHQPSHVFGGTYGGAYMQQAVHQQPSSLQYPAATPHIFPTQSSLPTAPKFVYLPQANMIGKQSNTPCFLPASLPPSSTLYTDQTGKTFLVNQPQYHIPMLNGKPQLPAQPYIVAASPHQYYAAASASSSTPHQQPIHYAYAAGNAAVYGRRSNPINPGQISVGSYTGVSGLPAHQVYPYM